MKSRRTYRFLFISLVTHLCFAIALSYFIISHTISEEISAIDVSILKVKPLPVVKRMPRLETPVVVPTPAPDFQIEPQSTATQSRSVRTHPVKTTVQSVLSAMPADSSALQPRTQVAKISLSSPITHPSTEPLATVADLPVQSDAPLIAGVSGGGSLTDEMGEGSGLRARQGLGRRAFGSGSRMGHVHGRNRERLTSMVDGEGAANVDDALASVTGKVALGGGIPDLPEGTSGAIVQGRGREIIGRLNLVRFEDPLHPNADI